MLDDEYATEACAAWDALFRAVGNPDTASGSDLSLALDAAVAGGDVASADRLAAEITAELRAGREHLAVAGGWAPRTAATVQLDRLFAAFEAMVEAKRAAAGGGPNDAQAAFEQAGGIEAWFAWIEAMRAVGGAAASQPPCPNVPVTP